MADWYTFVLYYLWIAPHILLLGVAALIMARRLVRKFPLFFFYCWYEVLVFLLLFFHRSTLVASSQEKYYQNVFIGASIGSIALRFGIIQEIFNNLFHDYERLEKLARISVRWLTALLVVAALVSVLHARGTVADNLMAAVALLDRSVAIIQAGILLSLFLFSHMFGLSWHSFASGLALGFGILACTDLAVWALRLTDSSLSFVKLLNLMLTGIYHVAVLVWLGYLLVAHKHVTAPTPVVPEMDHWSGELRRSR